MSVIEAAQPVAGVRFTKVGKLYHFDHSDYPELMPGDYVIVDTARGRHMGQIMGFTTPDDSNQNYRKILRPASPRDLMLRQEWETKQPDALEVCKRLADDIGQYKDVKFVAAQYNYDGTILTFLYTAEQKVNVSSLWSALDKAFDAKIEMRQIGPRDVAKLLGGYGACGELRCCSTFLTDFSPISIKMAKTQGISLNPSEITGMCGRLRCCLVYEYEQYVQARKQLPRRNKRVGTPLGEAKVIDVHPLQDAVTVYHPEEGRRTFQREELIPLEELEALQRKAKEPCNKHGDEPCDCGKKPGERNQDKQTVDQPEAGLETSTESSSEAPKSQKNAGEKSQDGQRKRGKRSSGRRDRRRGNKRGGNRRGKNQNRGDDSSNNKDNS